MTLPRLILIADGFTAPAIADRTVAAARTGVPWVHLRDHDARDGSFVRAAESLAVRLREVGARVTVNTRLDVASQLGTSLHVGTRGPSPAAARQAVGPAAVIGFSAHDPNEFGIQAQQEADYFFLSPIFPTGSKPGHPGVGLDALQHAAAATARPVYALGGVTPERVADCLRAGAHGIAVLSGILHADDPAEATRHYLTALDTPHSAFRTPQ